VTNIAFSEDVFVDLTETETWSAPVEFSGDMETVRGLGLIDSIPNIIVSEDAGGGTTTLYGYKYYQGAWTYIEKTDYPSSGEIDAPDAYVVNEFNMRRIGAAFWGDYVFINYQTYSVGAGESAIKLYQNHVEGQDEDILWGWYQEEDSTGIYHGFYYKTVIDDNGKVYTVFIGRNSTQLRYMQHYYNDPLIHWEYDGGWGYASYPNYISNDYPATQCCTIVEDLSNDFERVGAAIAGGDILHVVYTQNIGGTFYLKHLYNEGNVWSSPVTIDTATSTILGIPELLVDSNNNLHLFIDFSLYFNTYTHYKYENRSWSKVGEVAPMQFYSDNSLGVTEIVIDNRDRFHFILANEGDAGFGYAAAYYRITNEDGDGTTWKAKKVQIQGISDVDSGGGLAYDSVTDKLYFWHNDLGYTWIQLAEGAESGASSESSSSESSSSSADSKSSESSESSSESSSSESSSSESDSSSSADSKSSSSYSHFSFSSSVESKSSLSSESSSADSKSSSSESSSSSSVSSESLASASSSSISSSSLSSSSESFNFVGEYNLCVNTNISSSSSSSSDSSISGGADIQPFGKRNRSSWK
jgi:hypothetical protein